MTELPFSWRPRLGTVLVAVSLVVLLLPLAGIVAVRQYENELVRSTEAQLLGQGVLVRELVLEGLGEAATADGEVLEPVIDLGRQDVLSCPPDGVLPAMEPDPSMVRVGAEVAPRLRSAVRQTLVGVRVVDRSGIVVATSGSEQGLSLAERAEVTAALAGRRASVLRERISDEPVPPLESLSRGQRYRVFVSLPIEARGEVVGAVVLSRTPLDLRKALWARRGLLAVAAGGVLLATLVVSLMTALFVGRPVRLLIGQARRASRGERGAVREIRGAGTREMRELSRALSEMARTIEDREEYIRNFASHVSHEFKTPLTTIRGAVELLAEADAGDPAERVSLLRNAQAATGRLQRLVDGLLALARAEAGRGTGRTADLRESVDRIARRFRDTGFPVATSIETEGRCAAAVPDEAFEAALSSLLDNARSHGAGSARVDVRAASIVTVDVSDDGPGISAANAPRVFEPFFTTARDRGGTGLGLSIARALVESHGGSLELVESARGATFRVTLKRG